MTGRAKSSKLGWRISKPTRDWLLAFLLVFVLLVAACWPILDAPPYWDAVFGLWAEAHYLAETGFDYQQLRLETHGSQGGPFSYMTSVLPTLLALGMLAIPSSRALLIAAHLFGLLMGSAIVATVWAILRPRLGATVAALVAAALLSTPSFRVQLEVAGMEPPLILASVIVGRFLWHGRWSAAAAASFIAYLIKPTGMLLSLAALVFLGVLALSPLEGRWSRRNLGWGAVLQVVVLIAEWTFSDWGGALSPQFDRRNRAEFADWTSIRFWSPDLAILFLLGAAAWLIQLLRVADRRLLVGEPARRLLRSAIHRERMALFCGVMILAVLASTMPVVMLPRYVNLATPFFYLAMGVLFSQGRRWRRAGAAILLAIIGFNLFNASGRFFPDIGAAIGPQYARTGALLERSLEYREDQRSNLLAIQALAEKTPNEPILAGFPFVYHLSIPRFGAVAAPLSGFALNPFHNPWSTFTNIENANFGVLPKEPIFVSVHSTHYFHSLKFAVPEPEPGDEILFEDHHPSPLVVFRKKWNGAIPSPRDLERWYMDRVLPWASPGARGRVLADYRLRKGELSLAKEEMRAGLEADRPSVGLGLQLADRLLAGEREDLAIAACMDVLRNDADDAGEIDIPANTSAAMLHRRGVARLMEARLTPALDCFRRATKLSSENGLDHLALGIADLQTGAGDRAIEHLAKAIAIEPGLAEAHRRLAFLRFQFGDYEEAVKEAHRSLRLEPGSADAHHTLGLTLARQRRFADARHHFLQALHLRPSFASPHRNLRRLDAMH